MKPRVGVVSIHSLADFVFDEIDRGIDLGWEEFNNDLEDQIEAGEITEDEAEQKRDSYQSCDNTHLFGDWKQDKKGLYVIDRDGPDGFSATYNSGSGNVCIEYSKTTKKCNQTSPCYVMADGSGPCGDLDTPGDSVLAYSLPKEYFKPKDE
jgi:hypothetical protein